MPKYYKIERLREIAEELYWEIINMYDIERSDDQIDWLVDFLQDRLRLGVEE